MKPRLEAVVHLACGQLQSTSHSFIKPVPGGQCLRYKVLLLRVVRNEGRQRIGLGDIGFINVLLSEDPKTYAERLQDRAVALLRKEKFS